MQLILITQLERTKGRHSFPWTVRSQNKKETKEEKEGREGRREFPWWLLEKLEEKGRKRVSTLYPKLAESGPVRTMKMLETFSPQQLILLKLETLLLSAGQWQLLGL